MAEIDIRQAQLFVDDEIIEHQTLLERVVHKPVRSSINPLLCPENPWEGASINRITGVYPDEAAGGFRAWYVTLPRAYEGYRAMLSTITSKDGVHWTRPELDLCSDIIGRPSNVLFASPFSWDGPTTLPSFDDPEHRWKLVFFQRGSVFVGTSPDGLHWDIPSEPQEAILPNFGDRTTALFNPDWETCPGHGPGEPYVILSRDREDMNRKQLTRCIYRAGSKDLQTISSPPYLALRPDLEDGPYIQFYQMSAFRYESLFLGFLMHYNMANEPPFAGIELTVSRDTRSWHRIRPRTPFLEPSPNGRELGLFDYAGARPGNGPPLRYKDRDRDELRIYYTGGPSFHGDRSLTHGKCMGLAKLRPDGFVSLRAGRREGIVTTKPFVWPGGRLQVNYRVLGGNLWSYTGLEGSDGWLRVEVLGQQGDVIGGYSRAENDPLYRDSPAAEVTWSGTADMDRLIGERIAFRLLLRSAEIYSFRAVEDPAP